jgi:four helix bundle protein
MARITSHHQLEVYKKAMETAMNLFAVSREFPKEELYSLTNQIRRSSRSVCANLAEAWRRRRYKAAFLNKLNECEAEAAETQVWLEFTVKCGYLGRDVARVYFEQYDEILSMLVSMIRNPRKWLLPPDEKS